MLEICVPVRPARVTGMVPSSTGGNDPSKSNSRMVATTWPALGLYTPMFVRKLPVADPALERFVSAVIGCAALAGSPGMNIPTDPTVPFGQGGTDAGEYSREVTTIASTL